MGARLKLKYDFANNPDLAGGNPGPDLTLTRTTTATMKDADGYLRTVQAGEARFPGARWSQNLARPSQTFNVTWSETGNVLPIVGDEAVAPDGTQTADLMVDDSSGGTGSVRLARSVTLELETAYTYSMYVKANGLDWAYLRMSSLTGVDTRASFDLTNGVVGATLGADNIDQGIKSVGNGWYRCWVTFTSSVTDTSGVMNIEVAKGNADTVVDLDGTSSIFIWGAQLEEVAGAWDSENLALHSEDFGTTWGNQTTEATINTNVAVAPDGTMTADRLIDDLSGGTGNILTGQAITITPSTVYTFSVYAKADQLSWIRPQIAGMGALDSAAYFDLANGAIGTVGTNNISTFITDVGNGWYRCGFTFTSDASDVNVVLYIWGADGNNDITVDIDGTSSVLLWGAQLEHAKPAQTGPGPYIQTTGVAITNYSPSSYIPTTTTAVTSLLGTNDGLLVEEARTNICLQSEDFGTTWTPFAGQSIINTNQTTAPDGSLTADQLTDDGLGGGPGAVTVQQGVTVANSTAYTFSFFAKADQLDWCYHTTLNFTTPGTVTTWFDLVNGAVGTTGAGHSASIEDYGNGWYRCSVTYTTDVADTTGTVRIGAASSDNNANEDLDGTSSIFVWGAQFEVGAFPTSYIPTTTASVTRNADVVSTTDVSWVNSTAGTVYIDHNPGISIANGQRIFDLSGGAGTRYCDLNHLTGGKINLFGSNSVTINSTGTPLTALTRMKLSAGIEVNNYALYIDGAAAGTDTSTTALPTPTALNVGSFSSNTNQLNGLIKEIRYYDTRFDNATLEAMSSGVFPDLTGLTTRRKGAGAMWYNRMKAQREADLERFNKMMDAIHRR